MRVAPKLVAGARNSARERGKSDVIDAVAIARTALREGLDTLPIAKRSTLSCRGRMIAQNALEDLKRPLEGRARWLRLPENVLAAAPTD